MIRVFLKGPELEGPGVTREDLIMLNRYLMDTEPVSTQMLRKQGVEITWSAQRFAEAVTAGKEWSGWLTRQRMLPSYNLGCMELTFQPWEHRVTLSGLSLIKAHLLGCNVTLRGSEVSEACFTQAKGLIVEGCRLVGARLQETDHLTLRSCQAEDLDLRVVSGQLQVSDCSMSRLNLERASLQGALFERCDLRNARFGALRAAVGEQIVFEQCDLRGARFSHGSSFVFNNCKVGGVKLGGGSLSAYLRTPGRALVSSTDASGSADDRSAERDPFEGGATLAELEPS